MKKTGISQEGLKLIACVTMLIDHVGAVLVSSWYLAESRAIGVSYEPLWNFMTLLRMIGRISFPIYCFLLVEGYSHTRSFKKYCARMAVCMVLSEIPFDLAFSGMPVDTAYTNVMATLLLGLVMMACMDKSSGIWQIAVIVPFCLLAELLRTDYAANGVMIIAMFALTRNHPQANWMRLAASLFLFWFGWEVPLGPVSIPSEMFALISYIPIFLYRGEKRVNSRTVQWIFYLFYPAHLLLLWVIQTAIW